MSSKSPGQELLDTRFLDGHSIAGDCSIASHPDEEGAAVAVKHRIGIRAETPG